MYSITLFGWFRQKFTLGLESFDWDLMFSYTILNKLKSTLCSELDVKYLLGLRGLPKWPVLGLLLPYCFGDTSVAHTSRILFRLFNVFRSLLTTLAVLDGSFWNILIGANLRFFLFLFDELLRCLFSESFMTVRKQLLQTVKVDLSGWLWRVTWLFSLWPQNNSCLCWGNKFLFEMTLGNWDNWGNSDIMILFFQIFMV